MQIAEAFDQIDADDSGHITATDIINFLGPDVPKSYVESILSEADVDCDNRISYDEFLGLWHRSGDEKMKQDIDDVRKRRLRHFSSQGSVETNDTDISDEDSSDHDEEAADTFDVDEIEPLTPTTKNGPRPSASGAFKAEKEKSIRSLRSSSIRAIAAPQLGCEKMS